MDDPAVGFRQPATPPPQPTPGQDPAPASPQQGPPPPQDPPSLRGRFDRFRSRAGASRPLGSPEGDSRGRVQTTRTSSPVSTKRKRRTLDACATTIRGATVILDRFLGSEERDLVATANECYEIAAPIAGYVIDRYEESAVIATVVERAGLIAAGVRAGAYAVRAFLGAPGGRVEVQEAAERQQARMSHAERQREAEEAGEEETVPDHRYRDLVTVPDE